MKPVQIPTLDISQFQGPGDFVAEHGQAYEEFGFCGIQGHGISDTVLAEAYEVLHSFFALPADIKDRYVTGKGGARGYTSFGIETAKDAEHPDLKEFWQVGREMPAGDRHQSLYDNLWPTEVPDFRSKLYSLYEALDELSNRILEALALHLGLPQDWFADKTDRGNSILRPLHYPPIPARDTPSLRAAAHEDINLITLLVGSQEPGLEVLTRDGQWIPVTSQPGTIVVNIGDMMQRLTNHVLPSTTHKVVNAPAAYTGESRYSIPFFCHPNPDFLIETLPGCTGPERPNRYPEPILADDYLTQRLIEINLI
jgi:isopenicillin N synthase-like dioxygenase